MAIAGFGDFEEGTVPATPTATHWRSYFKTDGMYYVDDAGIETGPLVGSFVNVAYGGIYVKDAAVGQATNIAPAKLTAFAANGHADNCTPDHTDDSIAIDVGYDGDYKVEVSLSFNGSASTIFTFFIRKNGVESVYAGQYEFSATPKIANVAFFGTIDGLVATDKITVYVESDANGKTITVAQGQLDIFRVH